MKKEESSNPQLNEFDAYIARWHKNFDITEILDPESEEFMRMRTNYRHADETPIVLGLSILFPLDKLWGHKRGILDLSELFIDRRDSKLLDRARNAYSERAGLGFKPTLMRRGDYVANVDGLSDDGKQILDILPVDDSSKFITDEIMNGHLPLAYRMKIEHQMFVSQAKEAMIWLYQDGYKGKMTVVRLAPHNVNKSWMLVAWEKFQKHVETGKHPEWDKVGRAEW